MDMSSDATAERHPPTESKTMSNPTISQLNENDNPKAFSGLMLADDGINELWLFGDKVANRWCDDEGVWIVHWSSDVAEWGYDPETDCIDE